ncbi:MAG: lipopolysaccharide heptosyltransferase family protein [Candidatus Zixiibacteriota bacterium]|nr:MAG: lipopolysaccharide heptosyltransferase family protein [candidate division Zixibacteria bacterium]
MPERIDLTPGDRVLVSRTDKLGDLILALPFIASLKSRYPDCQVDVAASLYASPILENHPLVDGIVRVQNDQLFTNKLYRRDLRHNLRMAGYKAVVVLFPERQISRVYHRVGIPHRLGTGRRFHSVFFNHRLMHSRKANRKHEAEYNLDFLQFFNDGPTIHEPKVYPTERELRNARRILQESGVNEPFVVLHPGSGGSAENWPLRRFLELYRLLTEQGMVVIMSGSEAEGKMISEAAMPLGLDIRQVTGQTDLRTLAALLSLASTVVANSTGPLHLAVAVGTPVVGLYPSRRIMSPRRWGPLGEHNQVIQPDREDCPCPQGACRCMETIAPAAVARQVEQVFRQALV